jgi:hypothetical protein
VGELCIAGTCVWSPPPDSYLSTAADDAEVNVRSAPDALRLGAAERATFYYTLDGSLPMPGAAGTLSAMGQNITLPALNSVINGGSLDAPRDPFCRTVRWFADYGAPFGREITTHSVNFCNFVNDSVARSSYTTVDRLNLSSGGVSFGPIASVAPRASVAMTFRLRSYPPPGSTVVNRLIRVYINVGGGPGLLFCHAPARMDEQNPSFTLNAPAAPGRYPIYFVDQPSAPGGCGAMPIPTTGRVLAWVVVR